MKCELPDIGVTAFSSAEAVSLEHVYLAMHDCRSYIPVRDFRPTFSLQPCVYVSLHCVYLDRASYHALMHDVLLFISDSPCKN